MSTEKENAQEPKGKTIFIKYSTWKKGQHFATVLQVVPGEDKKVLIARVHFDRDKRYVAMNPDGKKVVHLTDTYVDMEKDLAKMGPALAEEELQNARAKTNDKEPLRGKGKVASQSKAEAQSWQTKTATPEDEIADIRSRGDAQSKDQRITR